jgi:hypothetical protein
MKDTKTVFGMYTAWDYQKELADINKMSEKGWHLIRGSLFANKYKKDTSVRYIYQVDYNNKIDSLARYIDTFREQGWEYISSTFNGWHYFRKVYDSSLPAEEYEIYCGSEALKEMHSRWGKLAVRLLILLGLALILEIIANIRAVRFPTTILCATLFIEFVMILHGIIRMKRAEKENKKNQKGFGFSKMLYVIFIGFILCVVSLFCRPEGFSSKAESYGSVTGLDKVGLYNMKVTYRDFYHFTIKGEIASYATIALVDSETKEEIWYRKITPGADESFELNQKVWLKRGNYDWVLSNFEGGKLEINIDVM